MENLFLYTSSGTSVPNIISVLPPSLYQIRIPTNINEVPDIDDRNIWYSDGGRTEMMFGTLVPEEVYRNKFSIFNAKDGLWY